MQLTIVIILCIFVILCIWFIQYRPQPQQYDTDTKEGFINFKKLKRQIVSQVKKQVDNIKATKGGVLLKLIPPVVTAKIAKIVPQIKKEEAKVNKKLQEMKDKIKKTERERKEREEKERKEREEKERKEKEKKRVESATKTINKLMELAPKYPDTKYDIQTIVNGGDMNNFIHGKNIISALQTYVNGSFPDPEQVVLLVKILRESMALTTITYT